MAPAGLFRFVSHITLRDSSMGEGSEEAGLVLAVLDHLRRCLEREAGNREEPREPCQTRVSVGVLTPYRQQQRLIRDMMQVMLQVIGRQ